MPSSPSTPTVPGDLESVYEKLQGIELPVMGGCSRQRPPRPGHHRGAGGACPPAARLPRQDPRRQRPDRHRASHQGPAQTRRRPAGHVAGGLEPARGLILDVIPREDAHGQERALCSTARSVEPGQLWIADRNFCTLGFLSGRAAQASSGPWHKACRGRPSRCGTSGGRRRERSPSRWWTSPTGRPEPPPAADRPEAGPTDAGRRDGDRAADQRAGQGDGAMASAGEVVPRPLENRDVPSRLHLKRQVVRHPRRRLPSTSPRCLSWPRGADST